MFCDAELDHSGWTPYTLTLLSDLAARLPFEEAAVVANNFGLEVSKSELERLTAPLAGACREATFELLTNSLPADTGRERISRVIKGRAGRLMILEIDGVVTLGKPLLGQCGGIEIKTVALYPLLTPSERRVIADVRSAEELRAAIRGLLEETGVTAEDTLVGLGDGAAWVEDTLDTFCDVSITDCYHAAQYLEEVMLALGWGDAKRLEVRQVFCRGEIDVKEFLAEQLPPPEVWLTWEEEARTALRYLEERNSRMRYPHFKEQGYPLGSGVIEGLNKSVIGSRMKRSGMQWSRPGAARMAALQLG